MRSRERIPYKTIVAATKGDAAALSTVLRHYSKYINYFSKGRFFDELGGSVEVIDDEIRSKLKSN